MPSDRGIPVEARGTKEWSDPTYHGVGQAKKYHEYITAGEHRVHSQEQDPSYRIKKGHPVDVAVGKGGNLGCYSKAHAGWDTKSSLTFGRRG
eukprot:CAMPEP_0196588576 /NCGR_PEP_ID=MMETSP1081-20130531/60975_1 /TAXON_ID=36882 /ORGANISM="Pyramimonas amylifera, Strain CCMP720" /LENGTH=91 /DNA_ID=CAMNT_0041911107 /DNA_START=661 /DNA_END=936 /DNA_ORIENTATION=+